MQEDVRRWFDRRTSRASDWRASRLVDVKGDTTVSVVLPALNEQETIGRVIDEITTCGGSIIVAITTPRARLRPRKRNRASA